ncbi:hypothetical protein B566_EDAN001346 [Ephemera danica]|nr:hypothetical protein B566_EDAN001346 [Ephemera danica]
MRFIFVCEIVCMFYARMNGQGADTEHFHKRIHCRSGHVTVQYKGRLIVWGGFMEHPSGYNSEYHTTDEIIIYNSYTEVWSRVLTAGHIPEKNSGSCGVIVDDSLYIFGGFQENRHSWTDEVNINDLYCLNLRSLVWKKLKPTGITPLPCDKLVGWTYKQKLRGWNNQLLCYDPDLNEWSWPHTFGPTPCPRAAHAADISRNTVYIFGGRLRDERMRNLHSLNMDTMKWSGNLTSPDEPGPEGRSWHSLTFINDCWQLKLPNRTWEPVDLQLRAEPRLWHQAAYLPTARILSIVGDDCWKLCTEGGVADWEEIPLAYDHGHPRFWHTAQCCAPGELIIHGGQVQPFYQLHFLIQEHADSMLRLNFEPKSLLRLCLNTAVEHFQETASEWSTLPLPLQKILQSRLEQVF